MSPYLFPLFIVSMIGLGVFDFFWLVIIGILGFSFLDISSTESSLIKDKGNPVAFRLVLWGYVPLHLAMIAASLYAFHSVELGFINSYFLILGTGLVVGTFGITVAHELLHMGKSDRTLSSLLLLSMNYGQYRVQHLHIHHVWAATPKDPGSAAYGVSLYQFLPRAIIKGFTDSWSFEKERVKRFKGLARVFRNRMITMSILGIVVNIIILLSFDLLTLLAFIGISLVSLLSGEITAYVQHYGLVRRELRNGQYEPMTPKFSWNSYGRYSNYFMMNMQRHGDHHSNPKKAYQSLACHENVPMLPFSNPIMVIIAMFPSLWFKIMNPRVQDAMNNLDTDSGI